MPYSENISDICRVGDYYDGQHDACTVVGRWYRRRMDTVAKCQCECHMELADEMSGYWWVDYGKN